MATIGERRLRVVAYDVVCDKRRARLAKTLCGFGLRRQKSVFECWLDDAGTCGMMKKLKRLIDETEDSVAVYTMCDVCVEEARSLGVGGVRRRPTLVVMGLAIAAEGDANAESAGACGEETTHTEASDDAQRAANAVASDSGVLRSDTDGCCRGSSRNIAPE